MKNNSKWKRIGSGILAVCLLTALVLSSQSFGVLAKEDGTEDIQVQESGRDKSQTKENSKVEVSTEEIQENTEEISRFSSADDVIKKFDWTVENGVVSVSGNGTKPSSISAQTSTNRSKYTGDKSIIFGYQISSDNTISENVNITVVDCGIMSDDGSIEIWKVTEEGCTKLNSEISVSEGKVSFTTNGLGEYLAVSDVSTVDLTQGNVTITEEVLAGIQQDGTNVSVPFSGKEGKKYRISQSNENIRCDKESNIIFDTKKDYTQERTIILDGINTEGEIRIPAKSYAVKTKLLLRNVNQVHRIYYGTGSNLVSSANKNSCLTIDDYLCNGRNTGELYIPYKMEHSDELTYVLTKHYSNGLGPDWSRAGIGGGRDGEEKCCTGLTIAGGKIRVLVQNQNGATAIGGGGNADAQISITGGDITAICSSTGAAIGGGIGWKNRGGNADISISGGTIYAENIGAYTRDNITYGGIAIGSGSSMEDQGNTANIQISGGNVTAYSHYGNGIGSGNSYEKTAANANILISGNSYVTTNALGGGTSQKAMGGSAEIKVLDNAVVNCVKYSDIREKWETETTNVLGAFGIGGGNSADDAKGGSARVTVSGGTLNCNGGNIGGGDATGTGAGGDAAISISGGTLDCASIGGGNSVSGMPGSVTSGTQDAGVIVTGGTLKTGTIGGGKNQKNEIGFATADISGGNIQGQFILSNTDQSRKCFFHMTGGTIDNKELGTDKYQKAQTNGGAVYLTDKNGEVNISGGTIQNATAELGGAVYMTSGSFMLSGDATIQNCTAIGNNDNHTLAQGGAVYLDNGTVTMNGGCILSSRATQGGAVYLKEGAVTLSNGTIGIEQSPNEANLGAGVYVAGGKLSVNGGSVAYNKAKNGAGAYLQSGSMEVSNGQILHNASLENGAGAYLAGGTLDISGGIITENTATANGGGVFLNAGNMTLSGGRIYSNMAVDGAGTYLNGGNLTMSGGGDFDFNTASRDGGGAYLAGGALTVDSGAFNNNTASGNGGGAYLAGGTLTLNGGAFGNNTATNGGGAYAADGKVRMFGGYIRNNTAKQSGGGFYVSSDNQAADVVIRSGTISGNKVGEAGTASNQGNGGAIAVVSNSDAANQDHVVIGLRHEHPALDLTTRTFTSFKYNDSIDNIEHTHESCPTIKDNEATGNGGGIYMASSTSILDIYCLLEENNKADEDATGGSIMSVGGNVNIGDVGEDGAGNNTSNAVGNILIKSRMLVKGGAVNLYGNTDNPGFTDQILVDIQQNAGSFADNRFTKITNATNYKIEYFENFFGSGMFTAIQYEENDEIPSMGTMYVHEGYKIVGWAKKADATIPDYTTESGTLIGSKDDHRAWDNLGDTGALKLYAIWQKISYTVVYNANIEGISVSGTMEAQSFTYGEKKALTSNAYKVKGKRFLKWNTESNGTGTSYDETYDESKITNKDGDTVKLYAQWVDCTHYGGEHNGVLSYSLNANQDTITESCDCGNYLATLKISGADVYYDGEPHPATLTGALYATVPLILYSYKETETGSYTSISEEPTKEGYYKASIQIDGKPAFVEYQIKSAASAATIDVVAKKGQHFTDIKGDSTCTVAQDDAFTIQYQVQALNAGANEDSRKVFVTAPVLTLSNELPAGTTIIMQTGGKYWYNNHPSGTEIALTSFTQMGSKDLFTYYTEGDSTIADAQAYRFIIDFSQVQGGAYIEFDQTVKIGLKYAYTNPSTRNIESGQAKEEKASITIGSKADFGVTASSDKKNPVTVTALSDVTDTRWEQKNLVWKIVADSSSEKLPSDAKLILTTTEAGNTETVISSLNQNGEFIIPFDWSSSKEFTFSLASGQESVENKEYKLTAALYAGSQTETSAHPAACEDNLQKASDSVELTIPISKEPALKISSTQKVLSKSETLKINVAYSNIDISDCSITGVIRKKDQDGKYNESSNLGQKTITGEGVQDISLASTNGVGSYCLWVTVSRNNQTILEVPYYFIIQE